MPDSIQKTYDEIPYNDDPIRATNLIHLATVGRLFGLESVDPDSARVLEIGCAQGGNLINLAYMHPSATFVGIDISKRQIDAGVNLTNAASITNVALKQININEIDSSWGKFDYIIAHGILSWVPQPIQKKIFEVCRDNLSENGIAYISYNTYPGWHSRATLREYMLLEANKHRSYPDKVKAAREILVFLQKCIEDDSSPTSRNYLQEIPQMLRMPDWYFIHDFLSEYNEPFYFHKILSSMSSHMLQYLGDSELASMVLSNVRPSLQGTLKKGAPDIGKLEHFLDFSNNRMFRRTLICHAHKKLQRPVSAQALYDSFVASPLRAEPFTFGEKTRFSHINGGAIETSDARTQQFLVALGKRWPLQAPYKALLDEVGIDIREPKSIEISEQVLRCVFANLLEISFYRQKFTTTISEKPVASRLARTQAKLSLPVSTLRHEVAHLTNDERALLIQLDGTRVVPLGSAMLNNFASLGLLES